MRRPVGIAALSIAAVLSILSVTAFASPAALAAEPTASQTQIEAEVMCPVCGTLLQLAESPQAQREKAFVRRLIREGKAGQQVKDALVAEYGEAVLALPKGKGFNLSAYLVPAIAFVVALVALLFGVLRWRRAGDPPGGDSRQPPQGPTPEDSARLDADLARYDL
ncbi:MAG: cytochrome c-type biogenesis protein [Solirubrobacterales bacterium]